MTSDPNKKTPRTFQCRDSLWQKFEQMARELECSVDYLVNDAMKQYARQRGYSSTGVHSLAPAAMRPPPPPLSGGPPAPPPPSMPGLPSRGNSNTSPVGVGRGMPSSSPAGPSSAQRPTPPPLGRNLAAPPPPPMQRTGAPPPMPRSMPPPPAAPQYTGVLSIFYQGERFPINKDRFIIGRGKQSSDLTIKDPNVSRQHAMIEFLNGQYYIVDMGSTNGVEYNGQRVQRKVINEGDVFRVCDHELQFSFQ